jgi:hypothetical protein
LRWGCLLGLWEVLIAILRKLLWGKFIFEVLEKTLFMGILGAWMTSKKAEKPKLLGKG